MDSIKMDIKTGWSIWKKISDSRQALFQLSAFVIISVLSVVFVKPIYIERIHAWAGSKEDTIFNLILLLHLMVTAVVLRHVLKDVCEKNKYVFNQLTVTRGAAFVVDFLSKVGWYYYFMVFLFVIINTGNRFLFATAAAGTVFYSLCFLLHYHSVEKEEYTKRRWGLSSVCRKKNGFWSVSFLRKHPNTELIVSTILELYRCKSLLLGKICFIFLLVFAGAANRFQSLDIRFVLVFNTFLILINDGYWKLESRNFCYFSSLGIPIKKYLCVHIVGGVCFNVMVPILLLIACKAGFAPVLLCLVLMIYMVIFWYCVQIYLWLTVDHERELMMTQWSILFLVAGMIPAGNIFVLIWLYKKIKKRWLGV